MNPYKTPCNPIDCEWYSVYTPCSLGDGCDKFKNYKDLKQSIRSEKAARGQSFAQRAKGVDAIFKNERGNRHRVGQK